MCQAGVSFEWVLQLDQFANLNEVRAGTKSRFESNRLDPSAFLGNTESVRRAFLHRASNVGDAHPRIWRQDREELLHPSAAEPHKKIIVKSIEPRLHWRSFQRLLWFPALK